MEPPRSLAAQLFLLAWDSRRERVLGQGQLGNALRAAALCDLVLQGRLAIDDRRVVIPANAGAARPGRPAGDPLLEDLVAATAADRPRRIGSWIQRGRRRTLGAVRDQLAADRLIEVERRRVAGLPLDRRVRVNNPRPVEILHTTVQRALAGGHVEPRVAALVVLGASAELRTVLTWRQRRAHRTRIAELTAQVGDPLPAAVKALKDARSYAG